MIPGTGTGNPGAISGGFVLSRVSMIQPQGTSSLSTWDGSRDASAKLYLMRGNCERRALDGNSGLILTAVRLDWLIELELQNRFWLDFRFGFRILTADEGIAESSQ